MTHSSVNLVEFFVFSGVPTLREVNYCLLILDQLRAEGLGPPYGRSQDPHGTNLHRACLRELRMEVLSGHLNEMGVPAHETRHDLHGVLSRLHRNSCIIYIYMYRYTYKCPEKLCRS